MQTWALGAILMLCTAAPAISAGARPVDAERAAVLHGAIHALDGEQLSRRSPPDELQKAFSATLLAGTLELAQRKGLGTEARTGSEDFARFVEEAAEESLGKRWVTVLEQRDAGPLAGLGRLASGDRWSEHLLAIWLGVPTPEDVAAPTDVVAGRPRLSAQMTASSRGAVRLQPDLSSVAGESGGPGAGNGVVDAGEWVQLSLALENAGESPWFSTSAWLRSEHECLFVDEDVEHELAETAGGETAALEAWIYLSRECPAEATFRILLRDTHQARSTPLEIPVQLSPRTALDARLAGTLIDADVPGSSEAGDPSLGAGRRIEVATDLELVRGQAGEAAMVYVLDPSVLDLMATCELRVVPMPRRTSRYFEAGDDLDFEGAAADPFSSALSGLRYRSRWFQGDSSTIWIGTDTTLQGVSPDPPDDGGAAPPPTEPPSLTTADFDAIGALVREHLRLVASPTTPELPGAVAAVEGYEVLFDRDGFMAGLSRLAGQVGGAVATGAPGEDRPRQVAYRFRHYVALKVEGPAYPAYEPPVVEEDPEPIRRDPDPPPTIEEKDPRTVFHLDPVSIQWRQIGGLKHSSYSLTFGLATVDRPVGFYLLTGFQPIPSAATVVIPLRLGAQFNSNGIAGARETVPWLNIVFQVGGTIDTMVEEEIFVGFEVGPAVDFFIDDHFSLGTGVTFGAGGGLLHGGEFRHTRWDILRLQFHN